MNEIQRLSHTKKKNITVDHMNDGILSYYELYHYRTRRSPIRGGRKQHY